VDRPLAVLYLIVTKRLSHKLALALVLLFPAWKRCREETVSTLRRDLRQGLRMLLANPRFTCIAVLSLAMGIGANTTIFAWIQTVLLNPLPGVASSNELVVLVSTHGAVTYDTVSYPDLKDYADLGDVFSGVVGSQITPALLRVDERSEWIIGQIATANFFDVLGVRPELGRTFLPEEGLTPGGHPVLVISYGLWQRRFGGDRNVVARKVELNNHAFTIIGVTPAAFQGTMSAVRFDFWAPLMMHQEVAHFGSLNTRNDRWLHTQARLRPGVTVERAQAAAALRAKQLEQAYPREDKEIGLKVLPLWKAPYGRDFGGAIYLTLGSAPAPNLACRLGPPGTSGGIFGFERSAPPC